MLCLLADLAFSIVVSALVVPSAVETEYTEEPVQKLAWKKPVAATLFAVALVVGIVATYSTVSVHQNTALNQVRALVLAPVSRVVSGTLSHATSAQTEVAVVWRTV